MKRYRSFAYDSARWEGFALRPGDIVISTPPKAGTTWTQRICALLIFGTPKLDKPLDLVSPWIDMLTRPVDEVFADLEAQTHRRFVKTHTPLDGLPWDDSVTYLCVGRDPRDIALSWDNHIHNLDPVAFFSARERTVGKDEELMERLAQGMAEMPPTEAERFWRWVDSEAPPEEDAGSLAAALNHLSTFWKVRHEPNVLMMHYSDMKRDLAAEMRRLAKHLGIAIPEDSWPELVEAATFDRMRKEADRVAPGTSESIWQSNSNFFHRGTTGQWRSVMTESDEPRYAARVRGLTDPELARWAHEGSRVERPTAELIAAG
jgi:aryl sulfotransferase